MFLFDPAAEQTPLKGSGLVSGLWVLLVSEIQADRPLLACMRHPQLQLSCHYVPNQSYILCTIWFGKKVWAIKEWSYGRRNIGLLDTVLVLTIYSF